MAILSFPSPVPVASFQHSTFGIITKNRLPGPRKSKVKCAQSLVVIGSDSFSLALLNKT